MQKSVKLLNVFIFLIIVYESNAKSYGCNYVDPVDISYLKAVDDYFDQVPVNRTANKCQEYTNACACKGLNCVQVCCSRKEFLPTHGCLIDNMKASPLEKDVILNTFETSREYPRCNWHTLVKNEPIAIQVYRRVEPGWNINIYKYTPICCKMRPAVLVLGVISVICYLLTIAAFLYFEQLRNTDGKCFLSCLICMCIKCLFWLLDDHCLLNKYIAVKGYITYFFWIASFLWFLVLNHTMRKVCITREQKIHQSWFRFRHFCSFVWLTASILTVLMYFVNYFWEGNAKYMFSYFIKLDAVDWPYTVAFYYAGMLILSLINMVWSIQVARSFLKTGVFEDDFISSLLFWLRLPTKLGVFWNLDLILCVMQTYRVFPHFLWVADYFHAAIGISFFLLFVIRQILEWLRKGKPVEGKPLTVDTFGGETSF